MKRSGEVAGRHVFECVQDVDEDKDDDGSGEGPDLLRDAAPHQPASSVVVAHHGRNRDFAVGNQPHHQHSGKNLQCEQETSVLFGISLLQSIHSEVTQKILRSIEAELCCRGREV